MGEPRAESAFFGGGGWRRRAYVGRSSVECSGNSVGCARGNGFFAWPSYNKVCCRLRPPLATSDPTGLIAFGATERISYRELV